MVGILNDKYEDVQDGRDKEEHKRVQIDTRDPWHWIELGELVKSRVDVVAVEQRKECNNCRVKSPKLSKNL